VGMPIVLRSKWSAIGKLTSGLLVIQEFLESFPSLRGLIRTQFPTSKL
jgi:hypothetical protein